VAGTQVNPATEDTLSAQLNITLSVFRDAIVNATTPKDLLDIFNQLAAILSRNTAQWGGTALTGRDISSDLANLNITLSAFRDAIVNATTPKDLLDIFNQLAATLSRNTAQWGGTALTGRDVSLDLANLNLTLTALRDAICAISPNNKTLNDLHARLAETLTRDISDGAGRILGQITDGTSAISPAAFGSGTHPRNITTWGGTALTGRDISSDIARLDIALSALRDAVCAAGADAKTLNDLYTRILEVQQNVYSQLIGADETVAQSITLDVAGRTLLDIYASASVAATFRLDVSNDNTNWISDYLTWAAVTEVKETHTNAFRYLRLKSDAAGAAGDLVSLYLTGGR